MRAAFWQVLEAWHIKRKIILQHTQFPQSLVIKGTAYGQYVYFRASKGSWDFGVSEISGTIMDIVLAQPEACGEGSGMTIREAYKLVRTLSKLYCKSERMW